MQSFGVQQEAILTYKNIDTAKGQSGSGIVCGKNIIGIHTGAMAFHNVGTMITNEHQQWITDRIAEHTSSLDVKVWKKLLVCTVTYVLILIIKIRI